MVAKTAAEEMDHFRKIALLAGEIGHDVSYVLSWPNQKRYLEAFRGKIETWEDFAIFGYLIDRVGRYQLEEFVDCSYQPLSQILPQVIKEEIGHVGCGGSKAAELAAKGDESIERLQKAVDSWYPRRWTCSDGPSQNALSVICIGGSSGAVTSKRAMSTSRKSIH